MNISNKLKITIAVLTSIVATTLNYGYIEKKRFDNGNLEITSFSIPKLSGIKNEFELEILTIKLNSALLISHKINKSLEECKKAILLEHNIDKNLLIIFNMKWRDQDYKAALDCYKKYDENFSKILMTENINIHKNELSINIIENDRKGFFYYPILIFITTFGFTLILLGIKTNEN